MKKNNKLDPCIRSMPFNTADRKIDEEKRTVVLPFSSDAPVERWDGMETLRHDAESIDFSRLNNGAAVLEDHGGRQIGVVERAWLGEDGRGWAELRFSKSPEGEIVWRDIIDGIRRNVSFGYARKKIERKEATNEYTVTRWMPYEVSIVSVPADPTVGVGRSADDTADCGENNRSEDTAKNNQQNTVSESKTTISKGIRTMDTNTTVDMNALRAQIEAETRAKLENEQRSEDSRRNEIRAIGKQCEMSAEAEQAVESKMTVDAFRKLALENAVAKRSIQASKQGGELGLTPQEVKEFSFRRAILGQIEGSGVKADYEREVSRAYAQKIGKETRGILVPPDVLLAGMERTFNQTTGAGSKLIATNLLAGSFIDILRNKTVVAQAGAMMMPGLSGNVAIPRQTGATTAYWFNSESAGITAASNPTIDQVSLSPKTVGAYGDISRSLLKQSTPAAEQLVRNDLAAVIGLAIDLAALKGTAADGQPRGITLTSGINSGNWDTANTPTWAKLVAMETAVDLANALDGNFVYVMGAALRGACKTTVKATGQLGWLMGDDGRINGYNVISSNQLGTGECIFGRFADLIIGMWGGLDLQVNPYIEALEKAGAIRVTALQDVDVAVRRPKSFTFYDNAAAS